MTAVLSGEEPEPQAGRRRLAAYKRANWLLSGAGVTLTLAGVPPGSPEVQAIRRALRAVNQASGLDLERNEVNRVHTPGGGRFPRRAG
jgi:hypothetical protein